MGVSALGFYGYTKNATGTYNAIENCSVKVNEYSGMGPSMTLVNSYENFSDSNGFFNVSVFLGIMDPCVIYTGVYF